jgi:hypothetical protein
MCIISAVAHPMPEENDLLLYFFKCVTVHPHCSIEIKKMTGKN